MYLGRKKQHKPQTGYGLVDLFLLVLIGLLIVTVVFLVWGLATGFFARMVNTHTTKDDIVQIEDLEAPYGVRSGEEYLAGTVFLGDSNTVRMANYGLVQEEQVLAVNGLGVNGVTSYEFIEVEGEKGLITMAQAVEIIQPERVIMTFGTNDVGNLTPKGFGQAYRRVIQDLRNGYSGTILITAIPPILQENAYPKLSKEEIKAFNDELYKLCKEEDIRFLDINEALSGGEGWAKQGYVVEDGIHYSKEGLEFWLKYIQAHSV